MVEGLFVCLCLRGTHRTISQSKPSPWSDKLGLAWESVAGYLVLEMLVRPEVEVVVGVLLLLGSVMLLRVKGQMVV